MIKWITDNLGTAAYNDAVKHAENFEIIDVRNLVDKEGNSTSEIQKKIDEGLSLLHDGKKIVVCCDYGMSRSNSIAAGILSVANKISLEDAILKVMKSTGETEIKIEMLQSLHCLSDMYCLSDKNKTEEGLRILITGASGFIGSELMKRFNDLFVIGLSSKDLDLSKDQVLLDLLVKKNKINTIIHLANPRIYTTNGAFGKSLAMLKNVLDVCVSNNVRLVFLSGWVIFSGYNGTILADEYLQPCGRDSYGLLKMLSEKLIDSYEKNKNLSAMILRLCSIYGMGKESPKFIWNFIGKCRSNQEIILHQYLNGCQRVDLLHVSDLVDAIDIAVRSKDIGLFNIGGSLSVSIEEIANMLIKKTNANSRLSYVAINDYTANITMNSSKFARKYGWVPKISLDKGLDELLSI